MPEWANARRAEARIDLYIPDFGRHKPAYGDYQIRSIDAIHLRNVHKALSGGAARALSWPGWSKIIDDAEQEKIQDHPLRADSGHHIVQGEFFPLIFTAFGSMGPGVLSLIHRIRELRGPASARFLLDSLAIALVRQIAQRIRAGLGRAKDWVSDAPAGRAPLQSLSQLPEADLPSLSFPGVSQSSQRPPDQEQACASERSPQAEPGASPAPEEVPGICAPGDVGTAVGAPSTSAPGPPGSPALGRGAAPRSPRPVGNPPERAKTPADAFVRNYWSWCRAKFDVGKFEEPGTNYSGLSPTQAKCSRDRLLAEAEVQLRAAGRIIPPAALIFATREDMRVLVASLPHGEPKSRLEQLGREGLTLGSEEHYPGWAEGDREPSGFWFTPVFRDTRPGSKGKTRPELAAQLQDTRVTAIQQRHIVKNLCPHANFRLLQPTADWGRGAGYPGHRQALIREEQAFEEAATLQRAEAGRLSEKIAQLAAAGPKKTPAGKRLHTAKLDALRTVLKKTSDEAELFARQALAAKRFTSPAGVAEDASPQKGPSPIDSLAAGLAESSLEGSLPPSLSQARAPVDAGNVSGRSLLSSSPDTAAPRPASTTARVPASPRSPTPSPVQGPNAGRAAPAPKPGKRSSPTPSPSQQQRTRNLPLASARPPGAARSRK